MNGRKAFTTNSLHYFKLVVAQERTKLSSVMVVGQIVVVTVDKVVGGFEEDIVGKCSKPNYM